MAQVNQVKNDEKKISQFEKRQKRKEVRQLHDAVKKDNLDLVQQLLVANLEVDFHYLGQTALQLAVNSSLVDMCRLLLDNGADVNQYTAEDDSLLNTAAWRGNFQIVQLLVSRGAELDKKNSHNSTPLNSAARKGHADIVRLLVKANSSLDTTNSRGHTPLATAVFYGHMESAMHIIDGGCDLNWPDGERRSPLIIAAAKGHTEMVRKLIDTGCDVNASDQYHRTATFWAARHGFLAIVELLVAAGADLNLTDTKLCTPLLEAVRGQHQDLVACLAKAGCNLNLAELETKQTAIHAAVRLAAQYCGPREDQLSLVRILINEGCDVNVSDACCWTPVYQAAFGGESEVVDLLLDRHVSLDLTTDMGNTPLHAAVFGNKSSIVEKLLAAGCDVNKTNHNNELPLYSAISHRSQLSVVKLLLDAGSEVDTREYKNQQSPLFCAIQNENLDVTKCLIDKGCDVNLPDDNGDCPLWVACEKGQEEIVSLLLNHPSIDVNVGLSHVPLHAAAVHGYLSIAEKLIKGGADVNKLSELGVSALYLATDTEHLHMVRLLVSHGADPMAPHYMPPVMRSQCCKTYKDSHPHLELEPIYVAVKNDDMTAFHLLLTTSAPMPYSTLTTLRDIIFRTPYARQARLSPQCLAMYAHVFTTILSHPRSLKHECRGVIRRSVTRRPFENAILSLPLPQRLHQFLLLCDDPAMRTSEVQDPVV